MKICKNLYFSIPIRMVGTITPKFLFQTPKKVKNAKIFFEYKNCKWHLWVFKSVFSVVDTYNLSYLVVSVLTDEIVSFAYLLIQIF